MSEPIWFEITVREDLRTPAVEEWLKDVREMITEEMIPSLCLSLASRVGIDLICKIQKRT